MANAYLESLARSAETVANARRGITAYPHDPVEVLASILQGICLTMAGGDPSTTTMPLDVAPSLTAPVQVSGVNNVIPFVAFVPVFPFGGTFTAGVQASVPADGSAAVIVAYPNSFAFATDTTAVAPGIINNYQTNAWNLTVQVTAFTATGFTVNVADGPTGSTVSVGYIASGY